MMVDYQKLISEKIQFVINRINERTTPLVAIRYDKGVLILAKNTVEMYRKTGILSNNGENTIVYGVVGEHQDMEFVIAQLAHLCNKISTNLSDEDINIPWLAAKAGGFISGYLKSGTLDCLITRLVLADKKLLVLVDETGMILPVEHFIPHQRFIVLASNKDDERRKIETLIQEKLNNLPAGSLNFHQALKIAKEALDLNTRKTFYELVVVSNKGGKIYSNSETLKLVERGENE